jgi:uncharacterized protein (TIGR00255 family)
MIRSMTGFARKEINDNGKVISVEVKSLNGRFLELKCRLPKEHSYRELEIRDLVKDAITHGTVNVNISVDGNGNTAVSSLNTDNVSGIITRLKEIKTKLKIKDEIRLEHIIQLATTTTNEEKGVESEENWRIIKKATLEALRSMNKMRIKEGEQILKDMNARVKAVSKLVDVIESLGVKRIPAERERLRQKIAMLFESDEIDEHRIQMELVLIADKLDFSEECVRLKSHIKFWFESIKEKDPVGKKLSFMLQEMNREINTIGSKCNDPEISMKVVTVKEELEKIREQVQNIE